MNIKLKILTVFFTIILLASPLSAIVEYSVTDTGGQKHDMDFYGSVVVWYEGGNGYYDIMGYDIDTDTRFVIDDSEVDTVQPTIYGDIVVYSYEIANDSVYTLWYYDLSDPEAGARQLLAPNGTWRGIPDLYKDKLVWYQSGSIYYMDISDMGNLNPVYIGACHGSPHVYEDYVVWYYNSNIYGYDLTSSSSFTICDADETQRDCVIWDNKVFWIDYRAGGNSGYAYMYDIDAPVPDGTQVTFEKTIYLAVNGDTLAWTGYPSGSSYMELYCMDLTDIPAGKTLIAGGQYSEGKPSVWEPNVVWLYSGYDGKYYSIKGADLVAVPDNDGPSAENVAVNPWMATEGQVLVSASIDDSQAGKSSVAQAEFFIDSPGADGTGFALAPTDGAFDEQMEMTESFFDIGGLSRGLHRVYVHGKDENGNWGAYSTANLAVINRRTFPMVSMIIPSMSIANSLLCSVTEMLPEDMGAEAVQHIESAQGHMRNAVSLTNSVQSLGALNKACSELQAVFETI